MARGTRTSGLVQKVKPFVTHDRVEMNFSETVEGEAIVDAATDPNSPVTGATKFDGQTAFGVLKVDGIITPPPVPPEPPIWSAIPAESLASGAGLTTDLNSSVAGLEPITFALASGALPTGITLETTGTFTGVTTDLLGVTGSATFTATNADGSATSGSFDWDVI